MGEAAGSSALGAAAIRSGGSSAPSSPGAALLRSRASLRGGDLAGEPGPPAAGPSTLGPGGGLPPRQPEPSAGAAAGGREALGNSSRERLGDAGAGGAGSAGSGGAAAAGAAAAVQQRVHVERPALRPGPEGGPAGAAGGAAAAAAR